MDDGQSADRGLDNRVMFAVFRSTLALEDIAATLRILYWFTVIVLAIFLYHYLRRGEAE